MNDGWRAAVAGGGGVLLIIAVLAMIGHERTTRDGQELNSAHADKIHLERGLGSETGRRNAKEQAEGDRSSDADTGWVTLREARARIETLEERVNDLEREREHLARRNEQRLEEIHQRIDDVVRGRIP